MEVTDAEALVNGRRTFRRRSVGCKVISSLHPCSESFILRNYRNFMKSGLPQRVLFHDNGDWKDFPVNAIRSVKENFLTKKAISEVTYQKQKLLLDFVHMVLIDTQTCSSKPIAWIDANGICFFPFASHGARESNPHLEEEEEEEVVSSRKRMEVVASDRINIKKQLGVPDENKANDVDLEEAVGENEPCAVLPREAKENLVGKESISNLAKVEAPLSQGKAPALGRAPKVPSSTWLTYPMFLAAISTKVSTGDMDLLNTYNEAFKERKITNTDLCIKVRQIIGDKLFMSTIVSLQHKLPVAK